MNFLFPSLARAGSKMALADAKIHAGFGSALSDGPKTPGNDGIKHVVALFGVQKGAHKIKHVNRLCPALDGNIVVVGRIVNIHHKFGHGALVIQNAHQNLAHVLAVINIHRSEINALGKLNGFHVEFTHFSVLLAQAFE